MRGACNFFFAAPAAGDSCKIQLPPEGVGVGGAQRSGAGEQLNSTPAYYGGSWRRSRHCPRSEHKCVIGLVLFALAKSVQDYNAHLCSIFIYLAKLPLNRLFRPTRKRGRTSQTFLEVYFYSRDLFANFAK